MRQLHDALDLSKSSPVGQLAPFPAAKAAKLFSQLFGKNWKDDLRDIDHLLLVPEGPLTRLPFPALLTDAPAQETFPDVGPQYKEAPWLARRFSISILPSLSALTVMRNQNLAEPAPRPFMGIGDPLLNDHDASTRGMWAGKASHIGLTRNAGAVDAIGKQLEQADDLPAMRLQLLREQPSLPDTAEELLAIAGLFGADSGASLLLREQATEARVKKAPLDQYKIVSFATHGMLAGELGKGIEPGLVLTPPLVATPEDDGYLSLSEVAQMKLNADWVVLSACNTGGGEAKESEGFTGLAKAFIYAGAKSLLVSHWSVSSAGTTELMGRLFADYKDKQLPRAKAHQRAMLQMIESDNPMLPLYHPSIWAPFAVVGDGG